MLLLVQGVIASSLVASARFSSTSHCDGRYSYSEPVIYCRRVWARKESEGENNKTMTNIISEGGRREMESKPRASATKQEMTYSGIN